MEYNDLGLVRAVQAGDREALELLVRRWYPRVYGYVYRMVGSEMDADDVTQEVFLALLRGISGYQPWKKFENWLFTIAHHKCMDHFRLQKREYPTELPDIPGGDCMEDAVALRAAVEGLKPVQRETVLLYYAYGFTAREIAHMTGTTLPTVKSRLAAAKKALKEALK